MQIFSEVFYFLLTRIVVNVILHYDKKNRHNDKDSLQTLRQWQYHQRRSRCSFRKEDIVPLYNRLKEYRASISVNQQEMGRLVGVSRQTISQIERGDYSPSVTLALKIAKVFDVPVEEIFRYEEDDEQ